MIFLSRTSIFLLLFFAVTPVTAQKTTKYVAEAYIVIDEQALDKYERETELPTMTAKEEILHDAEFYLTYTNKILGSMKQYGLDIEIRIKKMEIVTPGITVGSYYGAETLLEKFQSWLLSTDAERKIGFDFALLYTGVKTDANGIAASGSICREDYTAASTVYFGGMATAVTTSHEVAHLLGAAHDGKASYNTMRVARSYDYWDRFSFSNCSTHDILEHFNNVNVGCLLDTKSKSYLPDVTVTKYKGRLRDTDTVCRRIYGEKSYACNIDREEDNIPPEHVNCARIFCSTKGQICTKVQATEGTPCDKDKICSFGKCVPDTTGLGLAKDVKSGCVFGDAKEVSIFGRKTTCQEGYKSLGGALCIDYLEKPCCATCAEQEKKSNIPGCFGDSYQMPISGFGRVSCEEAIRNWGIQYICTNDYYSSRCCQICEKLKGGKNCPFEDNGIKWSDGDFTPCDELKLSLCSRRSIAEKCCKRCRDYL